MSQLHPLKVLNSSHLSEKASLAIQNANSYVFKVSSSANKLQVKKAIESLYKVEVKKVNIVNVKGKTKRTLKSKIRKKSDWKKAYVFLKEGNQIDLSIE